MGRGGVKGLAQMVWSTLFPHPNGQFLVLGGPQRLSGWFVNFLLIFAWSKKQIKKGKKVLLGACLTEGGGGL